MASAGTSQSRKNTELSEATHIQKIAERYAKRSAPQATDTDLSESSSIIDASHYELGKVPPQYYELLEKCCSDFKEYLGPEGLAPKKPGADEEEAETNSYDSDESDEEDLEWTEDPIDLALELEDETDPDTGLADHAQGHQNSSIFFLKTFKKVKKLITLYDAYLGWFLRQSTSGFELMAGNWKPLLTMIEAISVIVRYYCHELGAIKRIAPANSELVKAGITVEHLHQRENALHSTVARFGRSTSSFGEPVLEAILDLHEGLAGSDCRTGTDLSDEFEAWKELKSAVNTHYDKRRRIYSFGPGREHEFGPFVATSLIEIAHQKLDLEWKEAGELEGFETVFTGSESEFEELSGAEPLGSSAELV
ncbi:hypothetical protein BJ508DRAFT_340879 [Ascobolus immersus RN42]|uniref:Uncharacterized protein n=1 Tax=Ascobolus immersus RN42 TaxID=1160509 RepID=A0A3N4HIU5_ASCIM|nr:hypothetical protein BJ508DRAFT_340879 [Ascobolus immersus RN42]